MRICIENIDIVIFRAKFFANILERLEVSLDYVYRNGCGHVTFPHYSLTKPIAVSCSLCITVCVWVHECVGINAFIFVDEM